MPFIDRTDAGRQLADALASYKTKNPVVLALPRGGVPVAAEVAKTSRGAARPHPRAQNRGTVPTGACHGSRGRRSGAGSRAQ